MTTNVTETCFDEPSIIVEANNNSKGEQHRCQGEMEREKKDVPANSGKVPLPGKGRLQLGRANSSENSSSINSLAGRDDINTLNIPTVTYLTQYSIDHEQQSEGLCREVMFEECVPCFDGRKRRKHCTSAKIVLWFAWAIISSELFLYLLHVTSIVIGALNEVLGLRQEDPEFALFNSCIETSATLLLILIRMANAYTGYWEVRKTVRHEENFDPDKDIHVRLLKRWMIVFELLAFIIFGFSLGCFLVFYYHVHLGWTILSNNLCLITILVMATLYRARVVLAITRIREDQHKVAIYEAILVIEETMHSAAVEADNSKQKMFVRAVQDTKLFDKPSYIGRITVGHDSFVITKQTNTDSLE